MPQPIGKYSLTSLPRLDLRAFAARLDAPLTLFEYEHAVPRPSIMDRPTLPEGAPEPAPVAADEFKLIRLADLAAAVGYQKDTVTLHFRRRGFWYRYMWYKPGATYMPVYTSVTTEAEARRYFEWVTTRAIPAGGGRWPKRAASLVEA